MVIHSFASSRRYLRPRYNALAFSSDTPSTDVLGLHVATFLVDGLFFSSSWGRPCWSIIVALLLEFNVELEVEDELQLVFSISIV